MTEKLRALLDERASAPTFALPDLDAVRSAGMQRRRRRTSGTAAAGLVAAAAATALVLGMVVGGDDPDDSGPPVATDPPARGPLEVSWAVGTTIHDGDQVIEVEHAVRAYVRTSRGFVTVDGSGRVWSVVDGTEEQVGVAVESGSPHLVGDPGSSQVAWLDESPATGFTVHDQADGSTAFVPVTAEALPDQDPVQLYALSQGAVYLRAGTSLLSVDLGSDERTEIGTTTDPETDVVDAVAGQVAFVDLADYRVGVGPTRSSTGATFETDGGSSGELSPDARYLAFTEDEGAVVDVTTGAAVRLDVQGFYEPYEWWDDTTIAVVTETSPGSERGRLASCDVVSGACRTEVADLGPFAELEGFSVPVGDD